MNTNLKALAEQAGAKFFKDKTTNNQTEKIVVADQGSSGLATDFVPKFAELLIADIVTILENGWTEGIGDRYQGHVFAEAIQQRFGNN